MLKAAIVGCGKIADAHASQMQRIKGVEIVGVFDREPLMARQLQLRFPIRRCYGDLDGLLSHGKPDVVHITTPPQTHFDVARYCLERGCHVYVEKPFTVDANQARQLIALASDRGLQVTVGHDDQFSHVTRRMRALVASGFLGSGPVHMESYYCYELSSSGYAGALLGDKRHWVRALPGKLLHNIISHGLARIAEFFTSDAPRVIAHGFVSPLLRSLGEADMIDELRVIVSDDVQTTAYFTFSSQMRPALHQFRMFGTRNGLLLDQDQELLVTIAGARLRSYLEKIVPPVGLMVQCLQNVRFNIGSFLARDFQMKSGMKYLMEAFYASIARATAPPIPYREILLTANLMDAIVAQVGSQRDQQIPFSGVQLARGALRDGQPPASSRSAPC